MNRTALLASLAIAVACLASQPPALANTQQEKMTECNKVASAKNLKGDERKAFMSECLSNKPAAAPMTQQEKMTECNKLASAKSLKGDERKAFMSECLKKK